MCVYVCVRACVCMSPYVYCMLHHNYLSNIIIVCVYVLACAYMRVMCVVCVHTCVLCV